MSTVIRPVVSIKNPYYISKERYYELKHFCLQYKDYKRRIALEREKCPISGTFISRRTNVHESDKTGDLAVNIALYNGYTSMIESCCVEAGGDISRWLFKSVTEGKSYAVLNPPCGKDYFYERYRKFFWMLDRVR